MSLALESVWQGLRLFFSSAGGERDVKVRFGPCSASNRQACVPYFVRLDLPASISGAVFTVYVSARHQREAVVGEVGGLDLPDALGRKAFIFTRDSVCLTTIR